MCLPISVLWIPWHSKRGELTPVLVALEGDEGVPVEYGSDARSRLAGLVT